MQKTLISLFLENFFADSSDVDTSVPDRPLCENTENQFSPEIITGVEFLEDSDQNYENTSADVFDCNKSQFLNSTLLIQDVSGGKRKRYSVLFTPIESTSSCETSAIDLSKSITDGSKQGANSKLCNKKYHNLDIYKHPFEHYQNTNNSSRARTKLDIFTLDKASNSELSGFSDTVSNNHDGNLKRGENFEKVFKIKSEVSSTTSLDHLSKVPFFDLQCGNDQISSSTQDNNSSSNNSGGSNPASSSTDTKPKNLKCQECKICGRVLSSLASYYVHMKSHSDNKPYRCTYCEICFTRKPYLEVHLRTHTGERPFKCTLCDKTFTQKSSLNTHLRVHSGDKPFSCDICHKSFALKSYLSAHRWSHVGEAGSGVSCDLCGEVFTSRPQAAAHIRTHTAFACSLCHRSFTKQSFLVRHVARAHPERRLLDLDKRRKLLMDDDDSDRESLMTATPPPPPVTPVLAASRTSSPSPFHPSVRDIGTQNILDSPRYDRGGRDSPLMTPKPLQLSQPSPQPQSASNKSKNHHKSISTSCHNLQRSVHTSTSMANQSDNPNSSSKQSMSSSTRVTPSPMPQAAFPGAYNVNPANFAQPSGDFPNRTCSISPVQSYHIMVPTPCHTYPPPGPYPPVSVSTPPPHRGSPSTSLYTSHLSRPSHQRPTQ